MTLTIIIDYLTKQYQPVVLLMVTLSIYLGPRI